MTRSECTVPCVGDELNFGGYGGCKVVAVDSGFVHIFVPGVGTYCFHAEDGTCFSAPGNDLDKYISIKSPAEYDDQWLRDRGFVEEEDSLVYKLPDDRELYRNSEGTWVIADKHDGEAVLLSTPETKLQVNQLIEVL